MSHIFNRILENLATRLIFIIYILFIVVTIFFIGIGYFNELNIQKQRQYDKLQGVVAGIATNFDGDLHEQMLDKYAATNKNDQYIADSINNVLSKKLGISAKETNLSSPLYTLYRKAQNNIIYYGVRSDEFVDIHNQYQQVPELLIENFETGGVLPVYKTENGTWISAFHPIKKTDGTVVGLLEADINFQTFKNIVNKEYLKNLLISLVVMAVIFFIFISYARKILKEEFRQKKILADQKRIIEFKNKDITDSIHYALKIQNKILPHEEDFEQQFRQHFIYYKPKDIVAGDFYWMEKIGDDIFVAVADCTGHGVPGAILSILCASVLELVVCEMGVKDPGEILNCVRKKIIEYLAKGDFTLKDGMDIAFCRINMKSKKLSYSGAYNPIYMVRNGEMTVSTPNKQPIGDFYKLSSFDSTQYSLLENDVIFLFTDGYPDQFGGPLNKKFKLRNFRELLLKVADLDLKDQKKQIDEVFNDWKGDTEQIDDVCVIGIKI